MSLTTGLVGGAVSSTLAGLFSISSPALSSLMAPKDDWLEKGAERRREILKRPFSVRLAMVVAGVAMVVGLSKGRGKQAFRLCWVGGSAVTLLTPEFVWEKPSRGS